MSKPSEMHFLQMLRELGGFKMWSTGDGGLYIEASGVRYDASYLSLEEALYRANVHILSIIQARELIKQAKVTLE